MLCRCHISDMLWLRLPTDVVGLSSIIIVKWSSVGNRQLAPQHQPQQTYLQPMGKRTSTNWQPTQRYWVYWWSRAFRGNIILEQRCQGWPSLLPNLIWMMLSITIGPVDGEIGLLSLPGCGRGGWQKKSFWTRHLTHPPYTHLRTQTFCRTHTHTYIHMCMCKIPQLSQMMTYWPRHAKVIMSRWIFNRPLGTATVHAVHTKTESFATSTQNAQVQRCWKWKARLSHLKESLGLLNNTLDHEPQFLFKIKHFLKQVPGYFEVNAYR